MSEGRLPLFEYVVHSASLFKFSDLANLLVLTNELFPTEFAKLNPQMAA